MGLKVHKAVSFRAVLIANHLQKENTGTEHKHQTPETCTSPQTHVYYLAGQDVSEGRECVIKGLVVDGLVQVLDEDVAHTTLA